MNNTKAKQSLVTIKNSTALTRAKIALNKAHTKKKQLFEFVYGQPNAGKTTVLLKLIGLLAQHEPYSAQVAALLAQKRDLRIMLCLTINGQDKWVYVATYGDTKEDVLCNIDFFYNRNLGRKNLSIAKGNQLYKWNKGATTSIAVDEIPDVCVGACRHSLTPYYSLFSLAEIANRNMGKAVWREKERTQPVNHAAYAQADDQMAQQMHDEIMDWLK